MLIASIDLAYTPFINPASAKMTDVRMAKNRMTARLATVRVKPVKNIDTRSTMAPTKTPRMTPPETKPAIISHGGIGETSNSSIERAKNFDWKKVNEELA